MRKIYVIESVIHPGSFWANPYLEFKGWLYATKYSGGMDTIIRKAKEIAENGQPCKITEVYDK